MREAVAIIDRTLIHKDIAMAITDRPAAHEQVRSLTAWQFFPHRISIRSLEVYWLSARTAARRSALSRDLAPSASACPHSWVGIGISASLGISTRWRWSVSHQPEWCTHFGATHLAPTDADQPAREQGGSHASESSHASEKRTRTILFCASSLSESAICLRKPLSGASNVRSSKMSA